MKTFAVASVVTACLLTYINLIFRASSLIIPEDSENSSFISGLPESDITNITLKQSESINEKKSEVTLEESAQVLFGSTLEAFINRDGKVILSEHERKEIAFVHIGKTGGSTISALLRNGCHEYLPKPCKGRTIEDESIASHRIKYYYHVTNIPYDETEKISEENLIDFKTSANISSYVVTTRNPVNRLISAFLFYHPANLMTIFKSENNSPSRGGFKLPKQSMQPQNYIVYNCFSSLKFFALFAAGLMPPHLLKATLGQKIAENGKNFEYLNCTDIARQAINGSEHRMEHLHWNYQKYIGSMPASKEVFVIRQEHLWKDWFRLNEKLGEDESHLEIMKSRLTEDRNKRSYKNLPIKNDLTPYLTSHICALLENEIKLYISLLNRAVNLSDEDILESLNDLNKTCPEFFFKERP